MGRKTPGLVVLEKISKKIDSTRSCGRSFDSAARQAKRIRPEIWLRSDHDVNRCVDYTGVRAGVAASFPFKLRSERYMHFIRPSFLVGMLERS